MRLAKVIHSITLHTYMYVSNCAEGAKYKALVRVEIHVRKVIRNIPVYFTAPHMVQWLLKKNSSKNLQRHVQVTGTPRVRTPNIAAIPE